MQGTRAALPLTARTWDRWATFVVEDGKTPETAKPEDFLFTALYSDLMANPDASGVDARVADDWGGNDTWRTIQTYSPKYTNGYFLNAIDMQKGVDGAEARPENQQIYIMLFKRTLFMSLMITASCIVLGYPVRVDFGEPANAHGECFDDPCSAAILDILVGADICVEGDAATARCHQRCPCLARAGV
ncbi:hypothetical protein GQR58_000125 [Nymphon striatum]|nr:hypothetical protein GQR58_000125 [Nymphon striatum]